jgi:hypothetical protein
MKKNNFNWIIFAAIILIIALIVCFCSRNRNNFSNRQLSPASVEIRQSVDVKTNQLAVVKTNDIVSNEVPVHFEPTNTLEFFKVIVDPSTGQYIAANFNKEVVSLKDKDGKEIWSINLYERFSKPIMAVDKMGSTNVIKEIPRIGISEISSIRDFTNIVSVRLGQTFVEIDKQSGKIITWGSR